MAFLKWLKRNFGPQEVVSAQAFGAIASLGMGEAMRRFDTEDELGELGVAAHAILECLVEWQADHEHEWGRGVVLGKDGYRRRWIEQYPCLGKLGVKQEA